MPGATATGAPVPSKYITAALADLFSCIGAGDIVSAKALLEGKYKDDKEAILSATNPAGITVLQHACHSGQAGGVNMLLEKVQYALVSLFLVVWNPPTGFWPIKRHQALHARNREHFLITTPTWDPRICVCPRVRASQSIISLVSPTCTVRYPMRPTCLP